MDKTIGFGIIGEEHWYWSCGCAYALAINPKTKFVAMAAGTDKGLAKKIANTYEAENFYEDYRQLLENPEVDSVIITTTTDRHAEIAVNAAEKGKNILLNKPIARSLAEADEIIAAAEKNKIKVMVLAAKSNFKDTALKFIEDGIIGRPFAVHASFFAIPPLEAPGKNKPGWFVETGKVAGGGFIDHAVFLVGKVEDYFDSNVSRIYAEIGKFKFKNWSVDDHGIALVKFNNGSIATIEATFTSTTDSHMRFHIIGTEGELEVLGSRIKVSSTKKEYEGRVTEFEFTPPNPLFSDLFLNITVPVPPIVGSMFVDEFVGYILNNQEPLGNAIVARRHLECCLAAYKSVELGHPVSLPLKGSIDVAGILAKL